MPENTNVSPSAPSLPPAENPVSWWSWRPGARPRPAFLLGGLLTLAALCVTLFGLMTLLAGILDSATPPARVPGIVTAHDTQPLTRQPVLHIRLLQPGFAAQVAPVVSREAYTRIPDGARVLADYAPRLRLLYALESNGQRYPLPGASPLGNPLAAVAVLFVGLLLLPYPLLLTSWAWRDLRAPRPRSEEARVIALRAGESGRSRLTARPGLAPPPRASRPWRGVALQSLHTPEARPLIFSLSGEIYKSLTVGATVRVTYSPHLHHLYALKHVET